MKYFYKENKIKVFISVILFFVIISVVFIRIFISEENKYLKENIVYNVSKISTKVDKTLLFKTKTGNNDIVVILFSVKTTSQDVVLDNKNIYLEVENKKIELTKKYNDSFLDLGNPYNHEVLTNEFKKYFIVFEIPKEYANKDKIISFVNKGQKISIKLNSQKLSEEKEKISSSIGNKIEFKNSLSGISLKINDFDIQKKFLVKYNFCIKKECTISKEYITPSIDKNFDKVVLKLNTIFLNESELNFKTFYQLFSNFGSIKYKIADTWYIQKNDFEELKSKKASSKNNVYIGIDSSIMNAEKHNYFV